MTKVATHTPPLRMEAAVRVPEVALRCLGEIDLSNVDHLRQVLDASIAVQVPAVGVDLREIEYLDSAGIEALLEAQHVLTRQGRQLNMQAGPMALRLFRLLGLEGFLNVRSG